MNKDYRQKKILNSEQSEESRFRGKRVLILGLGLNEGGLGSARFFAKQGAEVLITDLKTQEDLKPSLEKLKEFPNIKYHLGSHKNEDIDWADLIIKNAGIKPDNKFIGYALQKGKQVETDIGIFLNSVNPKQIIGVTGTKGKTTTASLIYWAVKENFPSSVLAGNIGKSVLDTLDEINPETLVILEISSFQLQTFDEKKVSPHISVITNIYADHLNYHKDMEEYIQAKRIIAKYQTSEDFLFLNANDQIINSEEFLKDLKAHIIKFSPSDLPSDFKPTLPGEHNLVNYAGALAVAKNLDIPEEKALKNMNNFSGAEQRLQKVYEKKGITIINDSASTNPEAGIAALKTYPNSILIAGGMNKGMDYKEFAKTINKNAKDVYFFEGDATEEIKKQNSKFKNKRTYNNLEELLIDIKMQTKPGDVILFSPSATSFNLFHNEFDRGRKFNEAVEKVFK